MKALRSSSLAPLGFSVLALLLTVAAPTYAKQISDFPNGGSINVRIESPDARLKLQYGRIDPLTPSTLDSVLPLAGTQNVPVMVHTGHRLLTLQRLAIQSSDGSIVLDWGRKELDGLRAHARTGATLEVKKSDAGWTANPVFANLEEYELPASITGPGLAFSDEDQLDLIRLDDVEDSLLRIRAVSSATETFHQELISLAQKTPSIDALRLKLLLDGASFPAPWLAAIRQKLRDLPDSKDTQDQRSVLSANLALGEKFAPLSNRLLMVGLSKIKSLNWQEAESLLERTQTLGNETNEVAFSLVFDRLGGSFEALKGDQKFRFFSLAARKNAPKIAVSAGRDWYLNDSDKSISAALDLVRQLRPGDERDELSRVALLAKGPISVAEFAALTSPIKSEATILEMYQTLAAKISDLTAAQVLTLTSQRPSGEFRDSLILSAAANVGGFDADALRSLFLACSSWSARSRLLQASYSRITGSAPVVLAQAVQVLPSDPQRDDFLKEVAGLFTRISTKELLAVLQASISEQVAIEILESSWSRLDPFTVNDAAAFSDSFYKPGFTVEAFRDRMLLTAAERAVDLSRSNLDQLLIRASSDLIRTKISQIAEARLQKP